MAKHIEELRDMLCEELDKITEDGDITTGSLEIIDKLTHSIKSIDTIIAMEESGYSNDYRRSYDYDDRYSRRGSYARGRKRDSMGRYSRMYSRGDAKEHMAERLEGMMGEVDDPAVRQALQTAINHMED